jgi:glycosyltransferase involved in cell wall biosynthesis
MEPPLPGPPLRIAVLGDFDGQHTRRWLRVFIDRGHDVHAISFYPPREPLPGVTLHVLRAGGDSRLHQPPPEGRGMRGSALTKQVPPNLVRLIHALRYRRAGLKAVLDSIRPDVFHAHYAVEHGFYGAFAGFHPYVVSAWGSDLLLEPHKPLGRLIARYALSHADFVTAHDPSLARRAVELGVAPGRVETVRLGIDAAFFEGPPSVNLGTGDATAPIVISDRALEPLYNIDIVLQAFTKLLGKHPGARLIVANDGSERSRLEGVAHDLGLGESVQFVGKLPPIELRDALAAAHVYVSVPSSDSFALSNLEAMACGACPILSDLPSVEGMVEDGRTALLVAPGDVEALTAALSLALGDAALRREAAGLNRERAAAEGNLERNMLTVEGIYYRLARRGAPTAGS